MNCFYSRALHFPASQLFAGSFQVELHGDKVEICFWFINICEKIVKFYFVFNPSLWNKYYTRRKFSSDMRTRLQLTQSIFASNILQHLARPSDVVKQRGRALDFVED